MIQLPCLAQPWALAHIPSWPALVPLGCPASPGIAWPHLLALREPLACAAPWPSCRSTDCLSGSKLRDSEAECDCFRAIKLCQILEAEWECIKCPLGNGPWPTLPSRLPLVRLAVVFQLHRHHHLQRRGLLSGLLLKKPEVLELSYFRSCGL